MIFQKSKAYLVLKMYYQHWKQCCLLFSKEQHLFEKNLEEFFFICFPLKQNCKIWSNLCLTPYVSELGNIWINKFIYTVHLIFSILTSVWKDKTAKMWSMHTWMSYKVLSIVHIPKQMWHWWHFRKLWQKCITMVQ